MTQLIDWLFGVIARPVPTFNEIAREKPVGLAILIYSGLTALSAATAFYNPQTGAAVDQVMREFGFYIPVNVLFVLSILFGLISFFIFTALLNLLARLFGGQGRYRNLFAAYGFASFPMIFAVPVTVLAGLIGLVGTILSGIVSFGLSIWVIVLQVIALRESHGLSTGISILAYIIQLVILIVIPMVLGVGLVAYLITA